VAKTGGFALCKNLQKYVFGSNALEQRLMLCFWAGDLEIR
jgi:hypothetical protein